MKQPKLLVRDVPVGSVVFTLTNMDDDTSHEIRETYYTKISEDRYLHHGCIQGEPVLEEGERPRYINITFPEGAEYPLVPTLPVFDISQSRLYSGPTTQASSAIKDEDA